ncbi:hypothetical protein Bbelb_062550 [Branchiostoma belcheri]|nr:hypothetical protein Bbelb_062550 [Branchiostoma belcheri]
MLVEGKLGSGSTAEAAPCGGRSTNTVYPALKHVSGELTSPVSINIGFLLSPIFLPDAATYNIKVGNSETVAISGNIKDFLRRASKTIPLSEVISKTWRGLVREEEELGRAAGGFVKRVPAPDGFFLRVLVSGSQSHTLHNCHKPFPNLLIFISARQQSNKYGKVTLLTKVRRTTGQDLTPASSFDRTGEIYPSDTLAPARGVFSVVAGRASLVEPGETR